MNNKLDKEEIEKQAKSIIKDFTKALGNIKIEEVFVERENQSREEAEKENKQDKEKTDSEFKKTILKNAPKTKDRCIIAEKGSWIK